ncbi:amidohydrolase family protein [Streptomyces sp. ISL-43]|uniref:amidohydrolase family protein n=1 Tax=Streptomyces sp. ISL-43 TaxID=2819183 RepID=UPI001BEBCFCE|nr:amidohydrolase family protein [Streptomyces sp. ISL-43]MBT2450372.1 amidohydrolase family protein [Streptomyces sp. ISL-43]
MEYLISAGQVVTGPGGQRLRDGAVLVRGERIVGVGPRPDIEVLASPEATTIAFPNSTLLPGLIDCHVHLALDAGPDPVTTLLDTDDADLLTGMAERARQLLESGVTTVRDLGDRNGLALRLRDSIAHDGVLGPRILSAGTPLTRPGGHCWFFGGEVDGEAALRELVRRNAQDGVDVIKVMATGGGITKGGPPIWQAQFTTAELRLVVAEARQAGLPVAAHAHGTEGIEAAVAAGVTTLEHCTWMAQDGFDVRHDLVAEIVAKEIRVCPAASPDWRGFAQRFGPERAEEMFNRLRWMADQGVRLIAGTDAGVTHAVFNGFVSSLEFFRHIGLSPAEAIDSATVEAALALGIASDTGRLSPGYRADLLAVTGDPLTNLADLRDVRLVMSAGHPHTPPTKRR